MRCEGCISLRHIPATGILARRFELRICEDSWTQLIAVRPAVVQAFADDVHGVRRAVVTEVVRTHVRCKKLRADPLDADSVSQSIRVNPSTSPVHVHLYYARSNLLLLFTG